MLHRKSQTSYAAPQMLSTPRVMSHSKNTTSPFENVTFGNISSHLQLARGPRRVTRVGLTGKRVTSSKMESFYWRLFMPRIVLEYGPYRFGVALCILFLVAGVPVSAGEAPAAKLVIQSAVYGDLANEK